ncbi:hypothetical protein MPHO_43500 [Mycolicibacterium phocaicum]|nr:hypothetical protein MPHO_43500 [Mycolicibacterium phocaicum]
MLRASIGLESKRPTLYASHLSVAVENRACDLARSQGRDRLNVRDPCEHSIFVYVVAKSTPARPTLASAWFPCCRDGVSIASQPASRRDELLQLAAAMFAERGLKATTVRDIADSAGILSGSRYQQFKSNEQMVEEVTRDFLDRLFSRYEEIIATEPWEVASTIAFLASDYSSYLTGEIISAPSQRA